MVVLPQTTTIRRPFHWGIVVVVGDDWAVEDLPEVRDDRIVSSDERALIIAVRHAQDTDEVEGEVMKPAEAEVVVRLVDEVAADESRREVFRGVISVPTGHLTFGDTDGEMSLPAHVGDNTVVVSVDVDVPIDDLSPDAVQVDLLPG